MIILSNKALAISIGTPNIKDSSYLTSVTKIKNIIKSFFFIRKRLLLKSFLIIVSIFVLAFSAYFILNEIKKPSLERSVELSIKDNLKLPELIPYRKGNKWGYWDRNKKMVIPAIYDQVDYLSNKSEFLIVNMNGQFGVIDKKGNKIIPYVYSTVAYNSDHNNFTVSRDGILAGIIDNHNNIVFPFEYESIYPISNHYNVGKTINGKFLRALLSNDGKTVINFKYITLSPLLGNEKLFIAGIDKIKSFLPNPNQRYPKYISGILDYTGKIILPFSYDISGEVVSNNKKQFIKIRRVDPDNLFLDRNTGLLDEHGHFIIPCQYDGIESTILYNNYLVVWNDGMRGVINTSNEIVIPMRYDGIYPFQDRGVTYFVATLKERYGVLNESGEVIIPFEYTYIQSSRVNNFLTAHNEGKSYVIDYKNIRILPLEYESVGFVAEGLVDVGVRINDDEKWKRGYIDIKGNEITDFIYDKTESFKNGLAKVSYNKKWGLINKLGQVVVPIKYDDVDLYYFSEFDLVQVKLNDKEGYVDLNGVEYFSD